MNRPLPFKGFYTDRNGSVLKRYWTAPKDCKACPMKPRCVPNSKCKKITRTIYDEQYLRAYALQHSEMGKRMKKLRQSTVEPVFGSLTQFYGLRKIGVLGKAGAHKVMPMAAIAFYLKKYLKKGGGKPSIGIFKTIMDALQGRLTTFPQYIQSRPVLLGLGKNSLFELILRVDHFCNSHGHFIVLIFQFGNSLTPPTVSANPKLRH